MNTAATGRLRSLAEPLTSPHSRGPLLGFAVSELGDGVTTVVVPLVIYQNSGSLGLLAGSFAGQLFLGSAFAALGGPVADRWNRLNVVTATFVLRLALVLCLAAMAGANGPLFVLVGVLAGSLGSFGNPSGEALVRERMRHNPQSIAAARRATRLLSSILGPAVGATLIGVGGVRVGLLVDAGTFVVGLILLLTARRAGPAGLPVEAHPPKATPPGFREFFALARASEVVVPRVVSDVFASVAVAVTITLAVPYLAALADAPKGAYGWALSAYSIGAMAGVTAAGLLRWRVRTTSLLIRANVVYGLCSALGLLGGVWWMLPVGWLLWGVSYGPESVVADARITAELPPGTLGRIYGFSTVMAKIASGTGFLLAGLLGSFVSPGHLILWTALTYAVLAPSVLLLLSRIRRA
ncbi:MFS transporter [Amycolatopsis sp. NPDC088138]|uniref:MFS transporter n=1 Tax=Amycolatopsis sp. NPDC088138 TaxID=3363938 RepID=UPI00380B3FF7